MNRISKEQIYQWTNNITPMECLKSKDINEQRREQRSA